MVTGIGEGVLNRMVGMMGGKNRVGMGPKEEKWVKEQMVLLTYCLSWLHNHEKKSALGEKALIGKIARNASVLTPHPNQLSVMG